MGKHVVLTTLTNPVRSLDLSLGPIYSPLSVCGLSMRVRMIQED